MNMMKFFGYFDVFIFTLFFISVRSVVLNGGHKNV